MRLNQSMRSNQRKPSKPSKHGIRWSRWVTIGVMVVVLAGLLAACGGSSSKSASTASAKTSPVATPAGGTPHASPIVSASPTPTPTPAPAPSPAAIDFNNLTMIDEWRSEQVPVYPGSRRLDFKPETQSSVLNAGNMLYETADPGIKVIAYYRAALPFLGWKELSVTGTQLLMQSDKAAITISVSPKKGGTNIIMQLTDRVGG